MTSRVWLPLLDGVAYAAVLLGLLLIATVAPPAQAAPLELHWRPATAAEEREYERQHLADVLEEASQNP